MLHNLIEFGGLLFWIIVCLDVLLILAFLDESDSASAGVFAASIAAFYLLSTPPELCWQWICGYFVIGIFWFLAIFRYRIGKLKKFLVKYGFNINEHKSVTYFLDSSSEDNASKMMNIYEYEPSFARFFDRLFCWPFSILKIFLPTS